MSSRLENVFDTQGIDLLSTAFQKAWIFVEGDFALEPMNLDQRRAALASSLMDLAKGGRSNPIDLANAAINRLRKDAEGWRKRSNQVRTHLRSRAHVSAEMSAE